jgi:phosphohistidine phosphatase SixA
MMGEGIGRRFLRTAPVVVVVVLLALAPRLAADAADDAWTALATGGHVALIRHGNAPPGHGGDPPGFKFHDCKTQRNLDDVGREQGRAVGEAFRKHGIRVGRIVASPVCRCLDTAQLMAVGSVETSSALLPDASPDQARFAELRELVSSWRGPGTLVLVTHALTIRPLTGFLPAQAEIVVLEPESGNPRGGRLVGRIAPPR